MLLHRTNLVDEKTKRRCPRGAVTHPAGLSLFSGLGFSHIPYFHVLPTFGSRVLKGVELKGNY